MRYLIFTVCCVFLVSCVSNDPYTGEKKASNATKGVAIGAVAGAVAGAATSSGKNRDRAAINGALAGAAVGGGIGLYMDKQEAELRKRLVNSGVQVRREGNRIYLVMPGNITFDTGLSDVKSSFYSVLDSVAEVLAEYKDTAIKVSGHTDSRGAATYNQELSEKRASSVGSYLAQRRIPSGRIQAVGYGKRYPIASNQTAEGRQANRRVELQLEPLS